VTRMTNDVQNMHELFTTFSSMVFRDIFMLVGIAVVLMVLDWRLALAAFALLPVVILAAARFSVRARQVFRALRVKVAEINARMAETIDGIRTIQAFAQESYNYDRFARLNAENYRLGMREIHVFGLCSCPPLRCWARGHGGDDSGTAACGCWTTAISLGVLVAALTYVRMFFRPMRDLAENYNMLQNAMASAERIFGHPGHDERLPQAVPARNPARKPAARYPIP
jgi:ATP-binding cassette, subfamily B, multidrug efflux pump